METLSFSIDIAAPKEKVWEALWNDSNYRKWTSVFSEGSYAETDWKEGSKALFLTPKGDGMYSTIAKNTLYEAMHFKHLGVIKDGKEQPLDEDTKKWSGSMEKYTLKADGDKTKVIVDLDATGEFANYFNEVFPKALQKVKEISEN
jgi:hypothetical protein